MPQPARADARATLRAHGMKLLRVWVPDPQAPGFLRKRIGKHGCCGTLRRNARPWISLRRLRTCPLPRPADLGGLSRRQRLRRAEIRPVLQDGGRALAGERCRSVFAADHQLENLPGLTALKRMMAAIVELFCDSFEMAPRRILIDIDDTEDRVHSDHQLSLWNAHYDSLLPPDPHLQGDDRQAGRRHSAPRQDPGRRRGGAGAAPCHRPYPRAQAGGRDRGARRQPLQPGASDVQRLHPDPRQPLAHRGGGELGAVVRTDMVRWAVLDEQVGQPIQHVVRAQMPGNLDRQALARLLVDHRQHAELTPVMGATLDKVIGPHVVGLAVLGRTATTNCSTASDQTSCSRAKSSIPWRRPGC